MRFVKIVGASGGAGEGHGGALGRASGKTLNESEFQGGPGGALGTLAALLADI